MSNYSPVIPGLTRDLTSFDLDRVTPGQARGDNGKFYEGMGMYIHIPFCASKCSYCDFLSFEGAGQDLQKRYVGALLTEIKAAHIESKIDTVYFGGGTPTLLPSPLICAILQEVQSLNLAKDTEITVEMNPCTNAKNLLTDLKAHGVNRLSIGLQAWQDDLLASIKRAHTARDFADIIQAARSAGINNTNVDLMFGLPNQTINQWRETITHVVSLAPSHISMYSLTPAENTPLWDALEAGDICLPDETLDRAMYHEAISLLKSTGYEHYEISNFAKPGHESRHNVDCWQRKPYLGFGLGAHSFDGAARWSNTWDIARYLDSPASAKEDFQTLTIQDAMAEMMFLGLRMTNGVNPSMFKDAFGKTLAECYGPILETLISNGLLEYKTENIALTPLGLDLANQVFGAFL